MTMCRFRLHFRVLSDGSTAAASPTKCDDNQSSSPSFTLFSSLPPELRLKIWDLAASVPRIILASCLHDGLGPEAEDAQDATDQHHLNELTSRRAGHFIPPLLHANHESRTRALEKHYSLAFSWKVPQFWAAGRARVRRTHHHHNNGAPPGSSGGAASSSDDELPDWTEPHVYFNFERDALYLVGELEPYDDVGLATPMIYFLRKEDTARVRCAALAFSALKYGETGPQQIFGTLFHVVDRFPLCHIGPRAPISEPASTNGNGNGNGSSSISGRSGENGTDPSGAGKAKQQQEEPRLFVCVTPNDEWTHALLGGTEPLVQGHRGEWENQRDHGHMPESQRNQERQQRQSENGGQNQHNTHSAGSEEHEEEPEEPENVLQKIWTDWYRGSSVKSELANVRFRLVTEDEFGTLVTGEPLAAAPTSNSKPDISGLRRYDYREMQETLSLYLPA